LLGLLQSLGDRTGAIREYEAFEKRLAEDLELAPSPETKSLIERIRSEEQGPAPSTGLVETPSAGGTVEVSLRAPSDATLPAAEEPRKRINRPVLLVMFTTLALLLVGALVLRTGAEADDPRADTTEFVLRDGRVFVGLFENRTGDPELDVLGRMAADWISQSLARTGLVEVVPAVTALQDLTSFELAERPADGQAASLALAKMARARFLVSGSYHGRGDTISFQAQILDVGTGRLVRSVDRVSGRAGEPASVLEDLRQRTAAALATAVDPRLASWAGAVHDPPSLEAYRLYSAGLDTFLGWMQHAGNPSQAMREAAEYFHEAAALDSSFISPLLWAFYAHSLSGDWPKRDSVARVVEARRDLLTPWESALLDAQLSFIRGDWAGQYEAYQRVVDLSPASEWRYRLARAAMNLRRYREAAEILSALDPDRGWVSRWEHYWWTLTRAHHLAGDHEAELQAADGYLESYPESGVGLRRKAIALVALDRTEEAAKLAVQFSETDPPGVHSTLVWSVVMELRAHGHEAVARDLVDGYLVWYDSLPRNGFDARHVSTAILVLGGRVEEGRRVLEETVRAADQPLTVLALLAQLGWIAALQGDEEEARRAIARIEAEGDSAFSASKQALTAGIVANLGEPERAVALLRAAYRSGFPDTYGWHSDPALDPLRDYPPFVELMRPRE
jgi:tetratricopeptide (TPR) repeat protein